MSDKERKIKAAVFDLDGTLCDTLCDLADAVNTALSEHGFKERSLHEIQYAVGNGSVKLIERSLPEDSRDPETIEKIHKRYIELYGKNYLVKTSAYDGLPDVVTKLKKAGIRLAVVTNKPDYRAREIVERFYPDTFDIISGVSEGVKPKPDPSLTLSILQRLNTDPKDAFFVGDSDVDIKTAKNAGMRCISVLWGFRSENELISSGGERFAKTPDELLKFILP